MVMFVIEQPSLIEDLFDAWREAPLTTKIRCKNRRNLRRLRPGAKVSPANKDDYRVCMDVQQFSPEEITVKTVGKDVIVEAKHEEKEDEHGAVYRHFVRKYVLPEGYSPEDVTSSLSTDGVLSISVPKKLTSTNERVVPITVTGPAHATVRHKEDDKQKETVQSMDV